jgi:replicative DNA helicase
MWIMENIAKAGRKAIYINLEMSRDQMLAKAISRRAMEDDIGQISVSPLEVLRYYSLDKAKADGVDKALEKWMEEAGKNIIYNPDGVTNSLDRIMGYLDMVAAESKGPKPIICIDYLHLIDAGKDAMEGIKDATKRLKDYAVRNDTVVIIIIANGRLANKSGKSSMSDGRDSSAIEYTGDVMLSLSFWLRECGKAENEIVYSALASRSQNEFMAMMPSVNNGPEVWEHRNHIVLKVTKNRWGSFGQCELRSDGRHSRFTEWGTDANIRAMTNEERITQERLFPNKKSNRL